MIDTFSFQSLSADGADRFGVGRHQAVRVFKATADLTVGIGNRRERPASLIAVLHDSLALAVADEFLFHAIKTIIRAFGCVLRRRFLRSSGFR